MDFYDCLKAATCRGSPIDHSVHGLKQNIPRSANICHEFARVYTAAQHFWQNPSAKLARIFLTFVPILARKLHMRIFLLSALIASSFALPVLALEATASK